MANIQSQFNIVHADSGLNVQSGIIRVSNESAFTPIAITVVAADEEVILGDVITVKDVYLKFISGDPLLIGLDGATYPFRLQDAGEWMKFRLDVEGIVETCTVTTVADLAASLAGTYFDLEDRIDTVRVWMNIPAKAKQTLTLTGNALDGEPVGVGATSYTFKTTLTPAANEVLIGATASDSIDNLVAAITAGAGSGTLYGAGTTANASATAAAGAGDTMIATALVAGVDGNSIAVSQTLTNGTWGAATLAGGTASSTPPATPAGGRLVQATSTEGATATAIATAIVTALASDAELRAAAVNNVVTITDKHTGVRTNVTDTGSTGFTLATTQAGAASPKIHLKSLGTAVVVPVVAPN